MILSNSKKIKQIKHVGFKTHNMVCHRKNKVNFA